MLWCTFTDFLGRQSLLDTKGDSPGRIRSTSLGDNSPMFWMDNKICSADLILVEGEAGDIRCDECFIPGKPFQLDSNGFTNTGLSAVCTNKVFRLDDS